MGFREEDGNLIKLLVEETYNQASLGEEVESGFDTYFENAKESNFIDSFLTTRGIPFFSGENYDHFYRMSIGKRTIDLPKNITSFKESQTGVVSISKNEDADSLISVLSTLDPEILNSDSMVIYLNGKQSRTIFFNNKDDFQETLEYLIELSGRVDRINIAA
jgi:hypothetical protein